MGELEGVPGLGCNLLFQSANFKGSIQRAESNDGSQCKYGCQNEQNDTKCSGDNPTKVQVSEYGGNNDADDAIGIRHVAFHKKISFE
jgi:hypothetical protein